jgi:hypothetical protein
LAFSSTNIKQNIFYLFINLRHKTFNLMEARIVGTVNEIPTEDGADHQECVQATGQQAGLVGRSMPA